MAAVRGGGSRASILRTPTDSPLGAFPGAQRPIQVPAPPAGSEWSLTLPGGAWWRLLGGITTLTTSATVANRIVSIQYVFAGVAMLEANSNPLLPANSTEQINYLPRGCSAQGPAGTVVSIIVPSIIFQPGSVVQSHTYGLQVADQYGVTNLLFEEIYTGYQGEPYGQFSVSDLSDEQRLALVGR